MEKNLPEGVPLVAEFHDDRNRLSYYYPRLEEIEGVNTPDTQFFEIEGNAQTHLHLDYRDITCFMQEIDSECAFMRGDYSSAKVGGEESLKIESQDPYDIEESFATFIRDIILSQRHIGRRFVVREWIPHDVEVRYFIRDGEILYGDSVKGFKADWPVGQAHKVAKEFDQAAWSCDFIRHRETGEWYCIDMGLDGLYHDGQRWVAISEHLDKEQHSPENHVEEMPDPETLFS